jgi:HPt (histidine-containing phosphotransfer) domain-containing protein
MTPLENFKNSDESVMLSQEGNMYDLSMLEEMDDNEYMAEMLTIYLKETPEELREIREALTAGETETVAKKAHKLKNSAGVLQANRLIELLANIEAIAKREIVNDELINLVAEVHKEHKGIETGLKKYLQAMEL